MTTPANKPPKIVTIPARAIGKSRDGKIVLLSIPSPRTDGESVAVHLPVDLVFDATDDQVAAWEKFIATKTATAPVRPVQEGKEYVEITDRSARGLDAADRAARNAEDSTDDPPDRRLPGDRLGGIEPNRAT